jgi:uncharacterized protein (TIGR02145 family)
MITPAIRYISSFQDNTNSSSIPVPTPLMVDSRIWDQKNLNVSSYRSGRVIPQVKTGWSTLTTGAWRYYNDNPASAAVYGRLYNWYALMGIYDAASLADPSLRDNIAPVDWEVATYGEWITLRNILGRSVAAIALKEAGPAHWGPTNTADNSSYFTALPGGQKASGDNTTFSKLGSFGLWWPKDPPNTGRFFLSNVSKVLNYYGPASKREGNSIRLIKPTGVLPGFTTTAPTPTSNSFIGTGGDIPTSYSGNITERGVVWSTLINPTINLPTKITGSATNPYTVNITGLVANTLYYIRAYMIDSAVGVIYANNLSIFTTNSIPTVFTNFISQITVNSADCGGTIDNDSGLTITSKGVVWSTSPDPTIALSTKTNNGSGPSDFYSEIAGLVPNTKYYVKAYATATTGTGYGDQVEFTTLTAPFLNLIFNQYPAYHAYSLRQLSATYDYRCLRVRRTTGAPAPVTTTTVDVFFNSNGTIGLDSDIRHVSGESTLATNLGDFAAAAASGYTSNPDGINTNLNIFIVTWYDQSGNNINVTQSNTSLQPRIVALGVLILDTNNKVAARFLSQYLLVTNNSVPYNNESIYLVGSATATSTANFYAQGNINANARLFIGRNGGMWYNNSSSITAPDFTVPFVANVPRLYELICGNTTTSARSNGLELTPASINSLTVTNQSIWVGASIISGSTMTGLMQEVICLVGTPNKDKITPNIMDYYNISKSPYVTTDAVTYIEPTGTAIGGGNVVDEFDSLVTERGVCWSRNISIPTTENARTYDGIGTGKFISNLNYLMAYTPYYTRAYAKNSVGISYGEVEQFTTSAAPYAFPLDLFPSAHHAFSLRKLRSNYNGACLRVRRTTTTPIATTTTVDVRFDSNNKISFNSPISESAGTPTNATTLGQFALGIVDGFSDTEIFVTTWYDQSGNNKNVVSTTTTQQPRIVRLDLGVATLETKDGEVAIRFIRGSSTRLILADTSMNINNLSQYIVASLINTTNATNIAMFRFAPTWALPLSGNSTILINYDNGSGIAGFFSSVSDTVNRLYSIVAGIGTATIYRNQTIIGSKATVSAATQYIALGWSGNTFASNPLDGYIQESITYQNQSNVLNIQTNIMNYYGI